MDRRKYITLTTCDDCCEGNKLLFDRLRILEARIYENTYKKSLSGCEITIYPYTHKLSIVKNVRVFDADGNTVMVQVTILPDNTVVLHSNIDLIGHTILIY